MQKSRGRPRKYDEDKVLHAAGQVFWNKGYSSTSLDDLSNAMGMNRPSIYRAFGDKEAIYRQTLVKFSQNMELHFIQTLNTNEDIRIKLTNFYLGALEVYTSGNQAKGCMVMCTAVVAATSHSDIQTDLLNIIKEIDQQLSKLFKHAIDSGQITSSVSAENRAVIAQSLLHSLSIRSRAGESHNKLKQLIESGVKMITS